MSMGSRKTRKERRSRRRRAELREVAEEPAVRTLFLFIALFSSYGMALIFAIGERWSLATLLVILGSIVGVAIWIRQARG